ncbi:MAG TPA: hypothetical protein DCW60_03825 [Sutterella sp.]|nr:hypothetical protein [Sutterella sp.]
MPERKAPAPYGVLILTLPGQGAPYSPKVPLHYFDKNRDAGAVRDALTKWFTLWSIALDTGVAPSGFLENNTREIPWCDEVPEHLHGPQTIPYFATHASRVLEALKTYRPRVIIVLSAYLYEALGTAPLNRFVTELLGPAKGPARRITTMRLKALAQSFAECEMVVLPTPSKNTTPEFVKSLALGVKDAFKKAGIPFEETATLTLEKARRLVYIDEAATLRAYERELGLRPEEAKRLLKRLEGEVFERTSQLDKPHLL